MTMRWTESHRTPNHGIATLIAAIYARRVLGIALLGTLATPTVSVGACAWVLWSEESSSHISYRTEGSFSGADRQERESHSWHIRSASPTQAECENQQAGRIESMLKVWQKEKAGAKFGEHTITQEPGTDIIIKRSVLFGENTSTLSNTIRYLCLPDTVDPREKRDSR